MITPGILGIGFYPSFLIKSEIKNISHFASGEKLYSYAGLVPSIRSCGGRKAKVISSPKGLSLVLPNKGGVIK